ncbi:MAG: D-xylose ABC transporter ATP-binding protein, partial [Candidatus Eremiobacteraeota bacterium]|nr:D-xylose ABC transporter ATP-binding protein [Candidatus Eremiobacteraeota bacterium]
YTLMAELAASGTSIIMASSELPEVLGMSTRIAVMRTGRVVATLARDEATQESIMRLATGAQAA